MIWQRNWSDSDRFCWPRRRASQSLITNSGALKPLPPQPTAYQLDRKWLNKSNKANMSCISSNCAAFNPFTWARHSSTSLAAGRRWSGYNWLRGLSAHCPALAKAQYWVINTQRACRRPWGHPGSFLTVMHSNLVSPIESLGYITDNRRRIKRRRPSTSRINRTGREPFVR